MKLILFAVVSVIIARWFEKRFIVAAAAHSVLFLIFGLCLLYCSDCNVIVDAMRNISGDTVYEYIRYALNAPLDIFYFSYSTYLIVDIMIIFMLIAVSAAVSEQLIKRAISLRGKLTVKDGAGRTSFPSFLKNNIINKERKYIKYCRMLN